MPCAGCSPAYSLSLSSSRFPGHPWPAIRPPEGPGPTSAPRVMGSTATGLNDEDIENPAVWYTSQPPKQRRSCARHVLEFVARWPDVGPAGASLPVTVMIGME